MNGYKGLNYYPQSYFKTPGVGMTDPPTTGPTGATGGAKDGIGPVPSTF